jgi:CheY-like chemotaxis protein
MSNRMHEAATTASVPCGLPATGGPAAIQAARTVLLVEDDEQVLKLVSRTLSSLGHKVIEALDGEAALSALYRDPTIDCLFSDVIMPNGMNGLQLTQLARIVRPDLRAMLTSSRPRDEVRAMGHIPYDITFIAKPYSLTDISTLLRYGAGKLGRPASVSRRWYTDRNGAPLIIASSGNLAETVFSDADCTWVGPT